MTIADVTPQPGDSDGILAAKWLQDICTSRGITDPNLLPSPEDSMTRTLYKLAVIYNS